ncbi:hypothetical protein BRC86_02575 [Halobacteriales archaeon QS_3_64_16]|nr:MAG: hypothetical protein BRC86_02575 [Halobacteriales archaeon QS_3_64_16]
MARASERNLSLAESGRQNVSISGLYLWESDQWSSCFDVRLPSSRYEARSSDYVGIGLSKHVIAGEPNLVPGNKLVDGIGDLCEDADAIEARECEPVGRSNALGGSVYNRHRRYGTDIEIVRLDGIRPTL